MWVSWIDVPEDPSSPSGASNQIVGRYAFWMDDESTKINYNVARGKTAASVSDNLLPGNWEGSPDRDLAKYLTPTFSLNLLDATGATVTQTYTLNHPAAINLDALGVNTVALGSAVLQNGFFTNPESIKAFATGDPDDFYEAHKFDLTPFSRSPEFNVFGKPRLLMGNASSDLSAGPMYQHYSHPAQPVNFWTQNAGLASTSTLAVSTNLMRQLREPPAKALAQALNSDWPGMSGKRFRWTPNASDPDGAEESDRIAVSMSNLAYWNGLSNFNYPVNLPNAVNRFAGISGSYSEDGATSTGDSSLWKGGVSGRPVLPASVFPQLTELGVQLIPYQSGANWRLAVRVRPEYFYPPGFPMASGSFTNGTSKGWERSTQSSSNYLTGGSPAYMKIRVTTAAGTRTNLFNLYSIWTSQSGINSPVNGQKPQLPELGIEEYKPVLMNPVWVTSRSDGLSADVTYNSSGVPSNSTTGVVFSGAATVTVNLRFATYQSGSRCLFQVAPIYVPSDIPAGWGTPPATLPLLKAPHSEADSTFEYTFNLPATPNFLTGYSQSYEAKDSRLASTKHGWSASASTSDSLGYENSNNEVSDEAMSKWATADFAKSNSLRYQSVGTFAYVPVGVRNNGTASHTLQFHKYNVASNEIPDSFVLDLVAPRFSGPISYMNSTAGKINLNSKIYPADSPYFTPPARTEPLKALFHYMPNGDNAAANVVDYQNAVGPFDYVGRVCEVPGVADASQGDTEFEKEMLIRNLAGSMTTQSNTFGIWGAAQTIRKKPSNTNYAKFEPGDAVTGEKRFYAVVERYVWPGRDGIPGNGEVDTGGLYAKAGSPGVPGGIPALPWPSSQWAEIDGPQEPDDNPVLGKPAWANTSLDAADNPLAPLVKYRILYFTYLD
jgi:hypothetical protein